MVPVGYASDPRFRRLSWFSGAVAVRHRKESTMLAIADALAESPTRFGMARYGMLTLKRTRAPCATEYNVFHRPPSMP